MLVKENAKNDGANWLRKLYLNGLTENLNLNICKLVHSINLDMKNIFQLIGKMINVSFAKFH